MSACPLIVVDDRSTGRDRRFGMRGVIGEAEEKPSLPPCLDRQFYRVFGGARRNRTDDLFNAIKARRPEAIDRYTVLGTLASPVTFRL